MNKIWVIGLGPGHEDYMLPIAKRKILDADLVIGSERQLESISTQGEKVKLLLPLVDNLELLNTYQEQQIAVIVSGDPGFYSMLRFIKKHFKSVETYPGVSSLQYLFARLNLSYEEAYIGSLHGREIEAEVFEKYKTLGLLTDYHHHPENIRQQFKGSGKIHIGERLSYVDERISTFDLEKPIVEAFNTLSVVVIERD